MSELERGAWSGGRLDLIGEPSVADHWRPAERCWVAGVTALLASTALMKLWTGLGAPESLPGQERVFRVPLTAWSLSAGAAELVVVALLVSAPSPRWARQLIRAAFGAILGYRVLLAWHGGGSCGCLGRLLESSPWQGSEGLLLGGVAMVVFLVNEVMALQARRAAGLSSEALPGERRVPAEARS